MPNPVPLTVIARPSIGIVVTAFGYGRYLADALDSIAAQTVPPDAVVVVDRECSPIARRLVEKHPGATLVDDSGSGPSAARNAGLARCLTDYVLFLDGDDTLVPGAIEASLRCAAENPDAGFVYGAFRKVDEMLNPISPPSFSPMGEPAYHALLVRNYVPMHGTVAYHRERLLECGGFDAAMSHCEDFDILVRMSRAYPVASHSELVAFYRIHGGNRSGDPDRMLDGELAARDRNRPDSSDAAGMRAWRLGRLRARFLYALYTWTARGHEASDARRAQNRAMRRRSPAMWALAGCWAAAQIMLPKAVVRKLRRMLDGAPEPGRVNMGDLARTRPISRQSGYDRGLPIDRLYIEAFLDANRAAIHGRVLEIGEATYSRRFGSDIERQDVLHVHAGNPDATIVGRMEEAGVLPENFFDCIIVTQTLQMIYDVRAAVDRLHAALRPGGVILASVPGTTALDRGEWHDYWNWSFAPKAARTLFAERFGAENVTVEAHGNVYSATAFLHGLSVEEVERDWLEVDDPCYPVVTTVRAQRAY